MCVCVCVCVCIYICLCRLFRAAFSFQKTASHPALCRPVLCAPLACEVPCCQCQGPQPLSWPYSRTIFTKYLLHMRRQANVVLSYKAAPTLIWTSNSLGCFVSRITVQTCRGASSCRRRPWLRRCHPNSEHFFINYAQRACGGREKGKFVVFICSLWP